MSSERPRPRILIFVVAYNAAGTLRSVLDRIPADFAAGVEVLVIDDFSQDDTFSKGIELEGEPYPFRLTVLRNPENQGYGGNQKLGYRYAIGHGFDVVALLHGDGQYAPEKLPELVKPVVAGEADAVFGSRMMRRKDALAGGMPLYKWVGNQILTRFQNAVLGSALTEFHSGYRVYAVEALKAVPFERNSNDFHFDTEIIIQLLFAKKRIVELPIPTYYGDEICHVNGLKYAWDVFRSTLRAAFHERNLLYDRKYDVGQPELNYGLKLGFASSHTYAIEAAKSGARILDIGCGQGLVAEEFAKKGAVVTGVDQYVRESFDPALRFVQWDLDDPALPVDASGFDQIFLLDILEHLKDPEDFLERLRAAAAGRRPQIVITTGNVAFFVTRLALLCGLFNYGRKGILDRTHTRLFTFGSLVELLKQTGYCVEVTRGIPAPFPLVLPGTLGRALVAVNRALIVVARGLFSYQIYVEATALPTVASLLAETEANSERIKASGAGQQASV